MAAKSKQGLPAIGVVGLGNMGGGIARNFAKAGYPTWVWDSDPSARANFSGLKNAAVADPKEMAARCRIIIFAVPATPEIEEHCLGRNGIFAAARKGLIIYDFTTSDPAETRKLAQKAARKDIAYLDAGMSGGAGGADKGTLTLMIGGDKRAFGRTRRHLEAIADKLFHLGPSGAGHTAKLIHNMVCHAVFLATCEGGRMAEKAGIDLADLIDVFNVSNARSNASQARFPDHILNGKWDGRSRVYNLYKDTGMAVDLAEALGVDARLGADTHAFLAQAMSLGMSDEDFTLVYRDFDKIKKAKPRRRAPRKRPRKNM